MATTLSPYRTPSRLATTGSGDGPQTGSGSGRSFFTLVAPGVNAAISSGLFRQVRFLAQFGADVNERDAEGRTPLTLCARVTPAPWGVGLARLLLEAGAQPGARDRAGLSALHHAVLAGRGGLVHVLLGAADYDLNIPDRLGNTALHYAAARGNPKVVGALVTALNRYKLPLDVRNKRGVTPVQQALRAGHGDCAGIIVGAVRAQGTGVVEGAVRAQNGGVNEGAVPQGTGVTDPVERAEDKTIETVTTELHLDDSLSSGPPASPAPPSPVSQGQGFPQTQSFPQGLTRLTAMEQRTKRLAQLEQTAKVKAAAITPPPSPARSSVGARVRVVVTSARPTTSGQRSTTGQRPSSGQRPISGRRSARRRREAEEEVDPETELLNADCSLYRAASVSELRNRPELVFNVDPVECVRSGTAHHPHIRRVRPAARPPPPPSPASWRYQMKKLYGAFQFQFTPSFVAGVKPLPPEPEPSSEDTSSLRPSSALASESLSGSVSDVASVCSRRSVAGGRRSSALGAGGPGADGKSRRGAGAAFKKRQLAALLTLRGDSDAGSSDTSSTTTSGSGGGRRRKDDLSEGSSSSSGGGKKGKARLGALCEPLMALKVKAAS